MPTDSTSIVFAYVQNVSPERIKAWIAGHLGSGPWCQIDLGEKDLTCHKLEVPGRGWAMVRTYGIASVLEVDIRAESAVGSLQGISNINLGEKIVDELGGTALVDCDGEYCDPQSDMMVRISHDKLELVLMPDRIDDPIDESWTRTIGVRPRKM